MSTRNNRRPEPGGLSAELILVMVLVFLGVGAVLSTWAGLHLGHRIAGSEVEVPDNPFKAVLALVSGDLDWPSPSGWWVVGGIGAAVLLLLVFFVLMRRSAKKNTSRVDGASNYMGRGNDIEEMSQKTVEAKAKRLGVEDAPGVPIGKHASSGKRLFGSWEDMHLDIWGPRTGKTTSRAIPAILEAPGAVLVTSNKRDVVDATRGVRASHGEVWVFDPQGIAGESAGWYWNPLSYVSDEVKAEKLAEHFAAASTGEKKDAHFEDNAEDLLSGMFLAAALSNRVITEVYTWLTKPGDEEPADILRDNGFALKADQLAGIASAPDKERGSIYSTARRMAGCLTYRYVADWVSDSGSDGSRRQFDPAEFVKGKNTLYSLSKEGKGSGGPLVMALTAAVVEAAEELAVESGGGRLKTPLLGVLDEAANVCRWRQLPDLYSHYGSRGIVLMTILQSWSQGVDVWGESGMKKLWSAANVFVYGGNMKEDQFLESLSKLIGDYDRETASVSVGRGHRSVSRQLTRDRILSVDELSAMPKGRAVVLGSGSRPTLIRTVPWQRSAHKAAVEDSISRFDPQGANTIQENERELAENERELADRKAATG
ncbi:hypothetical protein GCM10027060_26580 [Nesterenkonia halophila]